MGKCQGPFPSDFIPLFPAATSAAKRVDNRFSSTFFELKRRARIGRPRTTFDTKSNSKPAILGRAMSSMQINFRVWAWARENDKKIVGNGFLEKETGLSAKRKDFIYTYFAAYFRRQRKQAVPEKMLFQIVENWLVRKTAKENALGEKTWTKFEFWLYSNGLGHAPSPELWPLHRENVFGKLFFPHLLVSSR